MPEIVVVGGGIGGLATAWRVQERARVQGVDTRITVVEANDRLGGVTETTQESSCLLEHGPDALLRIKPGGLGLIRDLGLEASLVDTDPEHRSAFIVRKGRLVRVPEGLYMMAPGRLLPFAFSPILSWWGKLRMGLDLILPKRAADAPPESLAQFVRRRLGQEALDRIAQPMVGGIYTADPEKLDLNLAMPQFTQMEQEHRSLILAMRARTKAQGAASGPRYGLFISLQGGLGQLVETLGGRLIAGGTEILLRTQAQALERVGDRWRLRLGQEERMANAVVLAVPGHAAAHVCAPDQALAAELRGIPYASVATVNLVYPHTIAKQLPRGAGFVVPACEKRSILAATFSSQKFPGRCPADLVVIRAFLGGALCPQQLEGSDHQLLARAQVEIDSLLHLGGVSPVHTTIRRWERAMCQPELGLRERLGRIRDLLSDRSGLHLVGSGLDGVGIPDVCTQAEQVAAKLLPA